MCYTYIVVTPILSRKGGLIETLLTLPIGVIADTEIQCNIQDSVTYLSQLRKSTDHSILREV